MWWPPANYSNPVVIPLGCPIEWPEYSPEDVVSLEVIGDIPYFVTDQCQPCTPTPSDGDAVEKGELEEKAINLKVDSVEALKAETKSINDLLTHLPKNPYCDACMRAKMYKHQSRRHPRNKTADKCTKFGEMIIAGGLAVEGRNIAWGGEM